MQTVRPCHRDSMGKQRLGFAAVMAAGWAAAFYRGVLRPWMYSWGAHLGEIVNTSPGDELTEPELPRTTRAISIPASARTVWPWLAQIGEDRGGFYSYSWLERALGAVIHNADHIHPDWQQLHVGDTVWLARRYGRRARQVVAEVAPPSHLVLVSPADFARLKNGEKARGLWSFTLHPSREGVRLVARGSGGPVGRFWFDVPHFIMEQKMLRGIRDRVVRQSTASTASTEPGTDETSPRNSVGATQG